MHFPLHAALRCIRLNVSVIALAASVSLGLGEDDASEELIMPGKGIGKIHLGTDGVATLSKLLDPYVLDMGISQNRHVWATFKDVVFPIHPEPDSPDTLFFIHTTSNGATDAKPSNGVTIDEIRVTSPEFHTAEGMRCGLVRSKILKALPLLRPLNDNPDLLVFVDAAHGIAFEFAKKRIEFAKDYKDDPACVAITVFYPNAVRVTKTEQVEELIKKQHF